MCTFISFWRSIVSYLYDTVNLLEFLNCRRRIWWKTLICAVTCYVVQPSNNRRLLGGVKVISIINLPCSHGCYHVKCRVLCLGLINRKIDIGIDCRKHAVRRTECIEEDGEQEKDRRGNSGIYTVVWRQRQEQIGRQDAENRGSRTWEMRRRRRDEIKEIK